MDPKIGTITIQGFRALRGLRIAGLGQVNLITGRNNMGKSSVLEALRIFAFNASPLVVSDILRDREEDVGEPEEQARPVEIEGVFPTSTLFHGFPQLSERPGLIGIEATGGQGEMQLTLNVEWVLGPDSDGLVTGVSWEDALAGKLEAVPVLAVRTENGSRVFPLDYPRHTALHPQQFRFGARHEPRMACISVSPSGGGKTAALGPLWDKVSLSDREKDVLEALRIIDPSISAVSMVGGEGVRQPRTAIVRSGNISRPVPLRSFGDGLNRLFGIVLSLVNARDGLLLIDEFENGMHHTVQLDVWRAVFLLAQKLDVQVFATSHSWDAVEAFQKAAAEQSEEGVLVRLSRKGEEIIPTLFRGKELAVATRDRIEVR